MVLTGLSEQRLGPDRFEVVVVDDGSTDGTAERLEARERVFPLRLVRQKNGGPAAARNAGVAAAQGTLVLFIDDDVVPTPDLISEHLLSHQESPRLVVIGPLASLPKYRQPWVAWEQTKLEGQYTAMLRGDFAPSYRQFWTGNASLAKEHIVAVGGFDRSFKRGEDVELGQRLWTHGLEFRFNPRAIGVHHAERSLDSWSHAHASYGRLEIQIFRRFGEDDLVQELADNFGRLHRLSRWLVLRSVGRQIPFVAAKSLLRSTLRLSEYLPVDALAQPACSALANLLYWNASAKELGTETIGEIFRRGEISAARAR
jgi:GT2 family glycosyltransferase